MNMNKTLVTIALLAALDGTVRAGGPLGLVTSTATNAFTYTHTGTSPAYLERLDIKCSGVNTATVTLVNYSAITNTLYCNTNSQMSYEPSLDAVRIVKDGVLAIGFTGALTTNSVGLYMNQK